MRSSVIIVVCSGLPEALLVFSVVERGSCIEKYKAAFVLRVALLFEQAFPLPRQIHFCWLLWQKEYSIPVFGISGKLFVFHGKI